MTARSPVPVQKQNIRKRRLSEDELNEKATNEGWEYVNQTKQSLELIPVERLSKPFAFKTRNVVATTRLSFFLKQITPKLIDDIINDSNLEDLNPWYLGPGHHVSTTKKDVYLYMAMYIYMQGNAQRPDLRFHHLRPMRDAIVACQTYFKNQYPKLVPMGMKYMEKFIANFHITQPYFNRLSENY
jgi:hypothetical protein